MFRNLISYANFVDYSYTELFPMKCSQCLGQSLAYLALKLGKFRKHHNHSSKFHKVYKYCEGNI